MRSLDLDELPSSSIASITSMSSVSGSEETRILDFCSESLVTRTYLVTSPPGSVSIAITSLVCSDLSVSRTRLLDVEALDFEIPSVVEDL